MTGGPYDLLLTPAGAPASTSSAMSRRRRKAGIESNSKGTTTVKPVRSRNRKTATSLPPISNTANDTRRSGNHSRRRKLGPTVIVESVKECSAAVQRLSKYQRVAVDCEGVALSRTGRLCLIQMATPDAVFFFDIVGPNPEDLNFGKRLFEEGDLRDFLENPSVWKVSHDCRHDSDALFHQYGVKFGPVIDTQVVFSVLRTVRGMPEGLPVSLKTLLKKFAGATEEDLVVKNSVKDAMRGDGDFWLKRPLSDQALQYARLDVEYLLGVSELLGKYIRSADKNGWAKVLAGSQQYVSVFRDDKDGPRKAQEQYEQMARVARRQRIAFEKEKRIESHKQVDPLRKFTFNQVGVLQALAT